MEDGIEGNLNCVKTFDANNHRLTPEKCSSFSPIPREHWKPGRFYCDKCSKDFGRAHDLKRHLQFCGGKLCDYSGCLKKFFGITGLKEHIAAKHTKEHLYFCEKCSKGFFYRSLFSKHKKECRLSVNTK